MVTCTFHVFVVSTFVNMSIKLTFFSSSFFFFFFTSDALGLECVQLSERVGERGFEVREW